MQNATGSVIHYNILLLEERIDNDRNTHTHPEADRIHTYSHTSSCKTLKPPLCDYRLQSGDDGALMIILTSATSLGSQLADHYDGPLHYPNDSSISTLSATDTE